MPTGLKRYQQTNQFHFLTFSCYRRQPFLATPEARSTLDHILEDTRAQHSLSIFAYVLMPEHIHLLTDEPANGTLATFLQVLKQRSSRALKAPEATQFWQRRYYDRNVATSSESAEKIQYIHQNPVKRGLVATAEAYRWSSANVYTAGVSGAVTIERLNR